MATWTNVKIEELIDLYVARPSLYNTKMKEYFNRDLRGKAIEDIATALQVPGIIIIYNNYII